MRPLTLKTAMMVVMERCPNESAKAYAHGMAEAIQSYGRDGRDTQIVYLLSNMGGWRGDLAREVKAYLKGLLKESRS